MDTIDCTDKPKVTGLELHQLIHDRFWKTQQGAIERIYPHKLVITNDQFKTINGGDPSKKNRKYYGAKDHTNTPAYCMEVSILE